MEFQNQQSQTVTVTRDEYEVLLKANKQNGILIDRWQSWLDAMWVALIAAFSMGGLATVLWTYWGGKDMALGLASAGVAIGLHFTHRKKKKGRR